MPWLIAAVALCALLFFFPKRGGLLLSILAGAALLIWCGIWAFNSWQDARIRRVEISIRMPEYPDETMELPASWADSGRAGELRAVGKHAARQGETPQGKPHRPRLRPG